MHPTVHDRPTVEVDTHVNQVGPNQTSTTSSSGAKTGEHTHTVEWAGVVLVGGTAVAGVFVEVVDLDAESTVASPPAARGA
ncbi:MAG: hypothetical protein L0I24_23775, partial [Pseudonocardia sp.]|nr:hypothetical protein [Pseudonocardia sp.]